MEKTKPILFIDLDDTVNLYRKSWQQQKIEFPNIEYPQSIAGFFLKLKPIKDSQKYIGMLQKDYDVWFLTRPSYMNPLSYTEKRLWVENHYGLEMCKKLILCPDKGLLKGDYLVDDYKWENFDGHQLLFGSKEYSTWEKVYKYLTLN